MNREIDLAIARRLQEVREQITSAAQAVGRSPESVQLLAVTKTKPVEMVLAAVRAGQRVFAENYVQEAIQKQQECAALAARTDADARPPAQLKDLQWHLIGALQTNKVKLVVGRFALIHAVDRLRLAEALQAEAARKNVLQDVLLEVNAGHEESKSGATWAEAPDLFAAILCMPNLRLRGLMAMPPLRDDRADFTAARAPFRQTREALEKWRQMYASREQAVHLDQLSMGTTSDFRAAIAEGATIVRVGSAIFGARE